MELSPTEIEYFNLQLHIMAQIRHLSFDTLTILAGYLKVQEIVRLSQTCKEFKQIFQIKNTKSKTTHIIENQENANIFYSSTQIQRQLTISQGNYSLQLIRFNIVTKDQGWVKDCESGSWVQAEFLDKRQEENLNQCDSYKQESKRIPLVHNYQVRQYQKKRKILHKNQVPKGSNLVKMYLRAKGQSWKISCQEIQVEKLYTQYIELAPKQMEFFVLRKKPSSQSQNPTARNKRRHIASF